jgi:protein-tyrosine phosphatase
VQTNIFIDYVTEGVYIGGARAVDTAPQLRQAKITRVLKLYDWEPEWPADFVVCDNALEDGVFIPREKLDLGVTFITEQVNAGNRVLVACGAGISRSSTFVLAYLLTQGYMLPDAWRLLRERHYQAYPLPQMWESLIAHYALPHTLDEVLEWLH